MPRREFIIQSQQESSDGGLTPLGKRDELLETLYDYNTGPDHEGGDTLYGPGIRIEMPPGIDPVTQMIMKMTEEEIAWDVVRRLATDLHWKLVDVESGRALTL